MYTCGKAIRRIRESETSILEEQIVEAPHKSDKDMTFLLPTELGLTMPMKITFHQKNIFTTYLQLYRKPIKMDKSVASHKIGFGTTN